MCIYKVFIRPHLDYGDIIFDKPENQFFVNKLESVRYRAALAVTGCIRESSREELYHDLGLESLSDRRWFRHMLFSFKYVNGLTAPYLRDLVSQAHVANYKIRSDRVFRIPAACTGYFQRTFFPYCISQWNTLDSNICDLPSLASFKTALLKFLRPKCNPVYNVCNPLEVKLLSRHRIGFSWLREHKFCHNFLDMDDPFCSCHTNAIETTEHFLLHCPNFASPRQDLFDNLQRNGLSFLPYTSFHLAWIFLYGDNGFENGTNRIILANVVCFIIHTKRFSVSVLINTM